MIKIFFFMKFISYSYIFVCEINEIYNLINEKWNWEIPGFIKIALDTSRAKIEPGSRGLNSSARAINQRWMMTDESKAGRWKIIKKISSSQIF